MRNAALVVLLAAATVVRAEESLDVVRPTAGYRLTRPASDWRIRELPAPTGTHHALRLELRGPPSEVSLTVYVGDLPPGADAEVLCGASAVRWARRATGPVSRERDSIAGEKASSLVCDVESAGTLVRVRQAYLVHDREVVLLQSQAPAAEFAEHEPAFRRAIASFAFLPPDETRNSARRLRLLAGRCGSEVPRAHTWAEASARASIERRLILVVFEEFRGLPVPSLADSTTFMDEDLVSLCRERFVVVPWSDELDPPFDDPRTYGLGPHTFGQGVLFTTSEGRVVGSIGVLEPSLVDEAARMALGAHPGATGPSRPDPIDAASALRRGELPIAEDLLRTPRTGSEWLLRAALRTRQRRADDALADLDAALDRGADPRVVDAARGLVLLRTGRLDEAAASLRSAGDLPAARYWLALTRAFRQGVDDVRDDLRALALEEPPTRWSCRAAAILIGRGVMTGTEAVLWPDDAVRDAAHSRPPLATAPSSSARERAVEYLLRTQRPNGTWPVPMSFAPDPGAPMVVAVTAIAGHALRAQRGTPRVDDARRRALEAVLRAKDRISTPRGGIFDYGVWAQIFAMRFLAASATDAPEEEAARLRSATADLVAAMARSQAPSGGWSYARLETAGASADNSIGFVTAAALLALLDARAAGVTVPDALLDRARDAVADLRRPDGSWAYQTASPGIREPTEAALRGPLCALALTRVQAGRGVEDVRATIAALLARVPEALREAEKSLCHTAPDGTSAYYLLFGLRYAAEAAAALPVDAAPAAKDGLRAAILRLRHEDGSFRDFPPVGPAYGTAMALEALDLLR